MEPVLWSVCANFQVQSPPHNEIQLHPPMSFSLWACVPDQMGGAWSDEDLDQGPTLLLACSLGCHLVEHFIYGQGYEEWCLRRNCLGVLPKSILWPRVSSAGTKSALCSFQSGQERLHRKTLLSNHPLLLPKAICSVRYWREADAIFESCKAQYD